MNSEEYTMGRGAGTDWLRARIHEGELPEVHALVEAMGSIRKVCDHLGIEGGGNRQIVTKLLRQYDCIPAANHPQDPDRRTGETVVQHDKITFEDMRREADDAIEQVWDVAQCVYDTNEAIDIEQDEATIRIDTDKPIGLVPIADLHAGAGSVNPKNLRGLINAISDVDGLYPIWNGDLLEGALAPCPQSMMQQQAIKVRWQRLMVTDMVSRCHSALAITQGQHEFFGNRSGDFPFAANLAAEMEIPYLGPGGTLYLQVGETHYSVGVWHKSKGNSIYDATAGAKKLCQDQGPFDVTFVADRHAPAVSMEARNGGVRRVFARGGTASDHCDYSKSLGYMDSSFNYPVVILWPGERKMWAWDSLADGLDYLEYLRIPDSSFAVDDDGGVHVG